MSAELPEFYSYKIDNSTQRPLSEVLHFKGLVLIACWVDPLVLHQVT